MDSTTLAYIAGFFDGEGCAYVNYPKDSRGNRAKKLCAKITQQDRGVLEWIRGVFSAGNIHASHDPRTGRDCHHLEFAYRQARIFLMAIEPYLKVKRENVTRLLDEYGRESNDLRFGDQSQESGVKECVITLEAGG